ncbi:hypothetical protein KTS45_18500 [Halomicroarcula limicola]|uniref:Uncharacterized protein n=1 Tax=Haloarcula limicola TaxID=1429915 RepID=A0A8J8C4Z8_9EURY|nr:hypothetical protein [Halomicroarcula limicola]MBV0926201.1 hypothetical protein [Halomicroarcula limicola]
MISSVSRRLTAGLSLLAIVPGVVAGQSSGLPVVTGTSGAVRAVGSFALVLLFGGAVLYRHEGFVDRSLDALVDRPGVAVFYGLMAYLIVLAVGLYGISQLGRVGVADTLLGRLAVVCILAAIMLLTGFGFLVVGTLVTDLWGHHRPVYGLVVGAGLSAIGWLVLPVIGGLAVWVVLAAFGIGGATRLWYHAERSVDVER